MRDAVDIREWLGSTTEGRFAAAFADEAVITKAAATKLLGLDEETLNGLIERKAIRTVTRGKHPGFTERDLRAYLLDPPAPCEKTKSDPKRRATPAPSSKVVSFSDRRKSFRRA